MLYLIYEKSPTLSPNKQCIQKINHAMNMVCWSVYKLSAAEKCWLAAQCCHTITRERYA